MNVTTRCSHLLALMATLGSSSALADDAFDPGGLRLMQVKPHDERVMPPDDMAVAVWPSGLIDAGGTHYLNQHNLTIIIVAVANPKARSVISSELVCDLPRGVDLKAVNANLLWNTNQTSEIQRDGKPYTRHRIVMRPSRDTIPKGKLGRCWWARYQPPSLWVTTGEAPGSKPGRVYLRLEYHQAAGDEVTVSPESSVELAVLPELNAKTPRIAKSGVMGRSPNAVASYENDAHEEHARLIAGYLKDMGCNIHMCGLAQSPSPPGLAR